ncbi:sRNA-binding protein [Paraburkholderia bannensis]|uniref:SRNA-binding protein n=1 Tax=Paraburkholderia bannensis TaxID=765414 RepID=A0A7W9TXX3_9BURK|nr:MULTISPECIES: ProQ/FINO family protein [Paraburkholderia]MBB3257698.1 sRNA-binding protein [Paraburkholderia sp. WP4_3_2]MBB6102711.1 sRNA-binding protein [Paraburkholderia bannensis]
MKAASQQRRPLSLKDGLLELKKSMGLGTGQPPEEQAQSPQGKHAPKGAPKGAQGQRRAQGAPGHKGPKGPRPAGADEARNRARPQHAKGQGQGAAQGKPAGEGGKPPRQSRGPRDGERNERGERSDRGERSNNRQRPARAQPQMANLSEAEKARIERNRQLNTVWNVFAKLYPAFRDRLPLKIGVAEDLVTRHPDYERTLIVAVLKRHVNHPRYHERVAAGGSRFELDGSASEGPGIDPSHVGRANAALARQKAKAEAQAKAQEAAKTAQPAAVEAAAPAQPEVAVEAPAAPVANEAVEAAPQPVEPAAGNDAVAQGTEGKQGATPAADA